MENNGVDAAVKLSTVLFKKLTGSLSAALWTSTYRKGIDRICFGLMRKREACFVWECWTVD